MQENEFMISKLLSIEKLLQELLEKTNGKVENKPILSLKEVAEYTNLKPSYVYKLTSTCSIPHSKKPNGRTLYFDRKQIDNWALNNKIVTQEELKIKANTYTVSKTF